MFEGLEALAWDEVEHAYGPAKDVPGLLRALASPDEKPRAQALDELYGNIYHQGTVYQATSFAVPFLIELAAEREVQGRHQILALLSAIANGHSYHDVHQHVNFLKEKAQTKEWQDAIRMELAWVENARKAVRAGTSTYIGLLGDDLAPVRAAAAYILANFLGEAPEIEASLRERLEVEPEPLPRHSMIRALGASSPPETAVTRAALLRGFLASEKHAFTRLAAAMALAVVDRERMPPEAVDALVGAIVDPAGLADLHRESPWAQATVAADASSHLSVLGPEAAATILPVLIEAMRRVDSYSALVLTPALLMVAFREGQVPRDSRAASLAPLQRSALTALYGNEAAWKINVNMAEILRAFGLPDWRERMGAYLNESLTLAEATARPIGKGPSPGKRSFLDRLRRWLG